MSKYKVGDQVRIIDHRGDCWNPKGEMDKYCGKVLTIATEYDDMYKMEECPKWLWGNDDIAELVSSPADIEPTKPSEPKFKVGMRVRITGDRSDGTDHLDGDTGTIVEVCSEDCAVEPDSHPDHEWYIWNYNMTPIEEVTPAVEKVEKVTNKKTSACNASIGYDIEIANLISEFIDDVLKVADKYKVDRRETLEAVVETVSYSVKDNFFWSVIVPMNDMFGKSAK